MMADTDGPDESVLVKAKHVKFYKRCLDILPNAYASLDTSAYHCLLCLVWSGCLRFVRCDCR
ncbi:hypothetical protein HOLleu_28257 [Holothuria leucospilota]|uniref:Uncharacterized protein n=1 Tax=Holothuria leucospilota TaxID=206669 RepID=A0A9Q1BLM1_HOLLE|nr:hypothetical protein HOLleu_28257 [Holothuria leucospilota]